MADLNKKIKNFRDKAAKMMKGTQKLKALYPGLYQIFCITDKSFEMNGMNFYEKLEETRNKTNKKYSLYAINNNKKTPLLTRNKSMNVNILNEPIPEKKRASLVQSKKVEKSNLLMPKIMNRPNRNYLLDDEAKSHQNQPNSIKISVISQSESVNRNKSEEQSSHLKSDKSLGHHLKIKSYDNSLNTSLLINNKKILSNLTSKSIFQNVKPLKLSLKDQKPGVQKKKTNEVLTYAQLIEKTGKFNIIPDINKNPLYNKFQQKLNKALATNPESSRRNNFNALSIGSSVFNLRIENLTNKGEFKDSALIKASNQPIKSKSKLESINIYLKNSFSSSKFSENSFATSFHFDGQNNKKESLNNANLPSLDSKNEIVENIKKEKIYWERLVSESEILNLIQKFEIRKCELLFLHLVLIFESDLSNMVPRFNFIISKIKGSNKGCYN